MRIGPSVNKARKPKFELTLQILDLNNLPLTSGTCFIKWSIPTYLGLGKYAHTHHSDSTRNGLTPKASIIGHKVTWNYEQSTAIRLHMDKHNKLEEQHLDFAVFQELNANETLPIGKLRLNLAEYANGEGRGREDDVVVRRYLMQDSKINSTIKIGIGMHQLDGETNFTAPPLRAAAVFEGFTGIIASEQEQDGVQGQGGKPPTGPSAELNELQDMYRLALAASWACGGSGELAADKCVEDIFAGGDGWGNRAQPDTHNPALSLHPDARRGSLRTWTNDESEDEGMGTATPANRESWASRTRRRIHTPRGTRTREGTDETLNEERSLREERADQRSLRERSIRYETRERERERSLRNEDRISSSRSLHTTTNTETRSLRSRSDQRSTRFDIEHDHPRTIPSRTASEHSRASGISTASAASAPTEGKASSIRTISSASLSTHNTHDTSSSTIGSRSLNTRSQQVSGAVYDPVNPLARTHFPDGALGPNAMPGDMTSLRAARLPSAKSPVSARFPGPRTSSPKPMSSRLGVPDGLGEREYRGSFDRERLGSASSWGTKGRRREEVLEWDVREDLRAWKVPPPGEESELADAGAARSGPANVESKNQKGGDGCGEDERKTSVGDREKKERES